MNFSAKFTIDAFQQQQQIIMISIMLSDEVFGRVVQLIRGLHPLTHSLALDLREGFCNLCVHSDKHSKPLAPQSGVCGSLWQSLISAVLHASLMRYCNGQCNVALTSSLASAAQNQVD